MPERAHPVPPLTAMPTELTILGSGILLPDDRRRSASHLVETERARVLLDCGSGALHGMERDGREWRGLTHILVTHFHTDHFGDLAPILWALTHGVPEGREEPLTLLGPPGFERIVHALAAAHGGFVLDPGFPVRVVELAREGAWEDVEAGVGLRLHPTPHTHESLAVRMACGDGDVGYTGDTGPEPALGTFFRGVDVLIAECAVADPTDLTNHLSPRSVAALARAATPGLLVLTHLYPELDPDRLPDLVKAEGYTGEACTGRDGLRVRLTPSGPERISDSLSGGRPGGPPPEG
jgi:ribonuclease BN (tRNA processing enzyme)